MNSAASFRKKNEEKIKEREREKKNDFDDAVVNHWQVGVFFYPFKGLYLVIMHIESFDKLD